MKTSVVREMRVEMIEDLETIDPHTRKAVCESFPKTSTSPDFTDNVNILCMQVEKRK